MYIIDIKKEYSVDCANKLEEKINTEEAACAVWRANNTLVPARLLS